jgi:hypothetical protein
MSDKKETKATIFDGGEINFIDIASLTIALSLFITQGNEQMLEAIGDLADSLKEGFSSNEHKENAE